MKEETFTINLPADLEPVADAVLAYAKETQGTQRDGGATVMALHGDLGYGKTTFMQVLARTLGVTDPVTSPTFVIMKEYALDGERGYDRLVHIDAYRIDSIDEMRVLGFEAILSENRTMIGIEWAERIDALLPSRTIHLTFSLVGEARTVTLSAT